MNRLYVCLLLFLPFLPAYSQTAGIEVSPNLTVRGILKSSDVPGYGFSSGLYYEQPVYKILRLTTGINYTQMRTISTSVACIAVSYPGHQCPERVDGRMDVIELPMDITLKGRLTEDREWTFQFQVGYALGLIIGKKRIAYYAEGQETSYTRVLQTDDLKNYTHFFRIGFDVSRQISKHFNMGIGARYKYAGIYQHTYSGLNNYNLVVKAGYRFGKDEK